MGYEIAMQYKVFVADIVDGIVQEFSVGAYTASTFLLHTRGISKHILLWTMTFISSLMPCWNQTCVSRPEKDPEAFSMRKDISLSNLHPSASLQPRYTKECNTSTFSSSTYIAGFCMAIQALDRA